MGDNVPFWFQRGWFFFKCIDNLRDQKLSPPMTHAVGFPSGNWGAMLTMRNQKIECVLLYNTRRKETWWSYRGWEKKVPEIFMKQNKNVAVQVGTTSKDAARCYNSPNSVILIFSEKRVRAELLRPVMEKLQSLRGLTKVWFGNLQI